MVHALFEWRHENMTIWAKSDKLTVLGSLCKLYYGNNIRNLSPDSICESLSKLSTVLGIDIGNADVVRFDAGVNLVLSETIPTYLSVLGENSNYKLRKHGRETVAYDLVRRTVQFYDKIAEMKKKRDKIPVEFENQNVLRYEIQWKNKVADQWKRPVFANMLSDPLFLEEIAIRMSSEFERIPKLDGHRIVRVTGWRSMKDQLAYDGIKSRGGPSAVLSIVEAGRKSGKVKSMDLSRIRKGVYDLVSNPEIVEPCPAAVELEDKIKSALNEFRMS